MTQAIWIIRTGVSVTMISFGVSQMYNPTPWLSYMPEWIKKTSPVPSELSMRFHAFGNLAIGLWLVLGILPFVSAWVALVWWVSILPFAFYKDWTLGMRDFTIISALVALVYLLK